MNECECKENIEIHQVVDNLIGDYGKGRDIDTLEMFNRPDPSVVRDLIRKLLRLIFPGYYRDTTYKFYNVEGNLTVLIEDVIFNLSKQIEIVLQYAAKEEQPDEATLRDESYCIALDFVGRLPKVREYVDTDLEATYQGDPAACNKDEIVLCYPGLYASTVNRLAHELFLLNVPLIPRMMTEHAHNRTGIDIHLGATIGKYFFMDHGTGIVVGSTTTIGDHVKVYQGVTLGALSTSGGQALHGVKRHPTIEDNVTIYSGASILGGDTVIGANSVIGSNAFLTKSVPAGTRVTIKNQELQFKDKDGSIIEMSDVAQGDAWYYMI
ncbi:MAG: serine acetyltransferase [Lachnospiraceae bacterium]|nr:serine acetyltransferase [Lachnospiraceae bacterium]